MLLNLSQSVVLLTNLQERVIEDIHEAGRVTKNCSWLIRLVNFLKVPSLVVEQSSAEFGLTISALRNQFSQYTQCIEITSPIDNLVLDRLQEHIKQIKRDQIIIAGLETHRDVLQTAIEFKHHGYNVYVIAEATSSRRYEDKQIALQRLRHHNIEIICREMLLFEWIRYAASSSVRDSAQQFLYQSA